MNSGRLTIDSTWTLFLDRDGVINRRIVDGYVRSWKEFEFLPGVPEAIKFLSEIFGHIIIVSNQQGVGKGLMTSGDVENLHLGMKKEIETAGGRIDRIYFCPFLEKDHSILRKPNVGMGLRARKEIPSIKFRKSVMAGDSCSDMLFGKRLKMKTVFLSDNLAEIRKCGSLIDFTYPDLFSLATILINSPVHQLTTSPAHHHTS